MSSRNVFRALTLLVTCASALVAAQPAVVPVQGTLADNAGVPLTGTHTLTLQLYETADGGAALFSETQSVALQAGGVFTSYLGAVSALPLAHFDGGTKFVGVTVDSNSEMTPRLPLGTVPYAARAIAASSADDSARVGGQPASAFAAATHTHSGYMPLGAMLTCSGTDKISGLTSSGNVVCTPDVSSSYAAAPDGGLSLDMSGFRLATGGVMSTHLADGAVTASKLADASVGAAALAANAVSTPHIADGAVTKSKLAGTPVALYLSSAFCAGAPSGMTTNGAACPTAVCSSFPSTRNFTCAGDCVPGSFSCPPTLLGYLLPP